MYMYRSGQQYEGTYAYDKREGNGRFDYGRDGNGAYYDGEWSNGDRHGNGVEQFPDGSIYEGGYQYGQHHGQGSLTLVNNKDKLVGIWEYGLFISGNHLDMYGRLKGVVQDGGDNINACDLSSSNTVTTNESSNISVDVFDDDSS